METSPVDWVRDLDEDVQNNNKEQNGVDIPTVGELQELIEALTHDLPSSLWTYRSVHRFVPCSSLSELKLGVFQECFLGEDYTKVTKYSYDSVNSTKRRRCLDDLRCEGRSRGHSFTGQDKKQTHYRAGTLRRAKSDLTLTPIAIYPISLESFRPYQNPVLKLKFTTTDTGDSIKPSGVAFLPNNNIIIAHSDTGELNIYRHEDGISTQTITTQFLKTQSVNVTKDGYVIVTDGWDKNLRAFTRGGEMVCKFGTGYFKNPSAIAVDSKDNYVVIDSRGPWQQYVFHYTPMTGVLTKIGYDAHEMLLISHPEGVAVGTNDTVLVHRLR